MDSSPEPPEFLTLEGKTARYAPVGNVTLDAAVEMIGRAIEYCRELKISGMLIDVRELKGFPHPTVVDRYWFVRKWAANSGGQVVLAFVQRPEMIDPEQIGPVMASNAGLIANVFEDEPSARNWLLANI